MKVKRIIEAEVKSQELMVGDKLQIADAEWKVLEVKDGKALIWKCTKITNHVFNENGSNKYEGSDIQRYLKDKFPETMPLEVLERVTDDGFFLLTVDQIRKYMPRNIDRIATDENGMTTWYWTPSPYVGNGYTVRGIYPAGGIANVGASDSLGVAPACWIRL